MGSHLCVLWENFENGIFYVRAMFQQKNLIKIVFKEQDFTYNSKTMRGNLTTDIKANVNCTLSVIYFNYGFGTKTFKNKIILMWYAWAQHVRLVGKAHHV